MKRRLTLLSLAAALLYAGPFLAGLAEAPAALVPVFAAIVMIWIVTLRPTIWARIAAGGAPALLTARLGAITLTEVLAPVACFALGRGLAGLLDSAVALPVWTTVALSLAAIPLGRLAWNPEADRAALKALLDEADASADDRPAAAAGAAATAAGEHRPA